MQVRFDKYKPAGQITPPLNGAVWHQQAEDGNEIDDGVHEAMGAFF